MPCNGLKKGSFHLSVHPKWSSILFRKTHFDRFFAEFWFQNSPFSRHFVGLEWAKWLAMRSYRAHFSCLWTPNGVRSSLERHIFDPLFTFFVPKQSVC